jgi:hypothetical protein
MGELERDPVYVARRTAQERAAAAQGAAVAGDELGLLAALRSVGVRVRSVWAFVSDTPTPPQAVPILLAHLLQPHHPVLREGIIRSLAYGHLRDAAFPHLKGLFAHATNPDERWLIANSLAAMASLRELEGLEGIREYSKLFRKTPAKRRRS